MMNIEVYRYNPLFRVKSTIISAALFGSSKERVLFVGSKDGLVGKYIITYNKNLEIEATLEEWRQVSDEPITHLLVMEESGYLLSLSNEVLKAWDVNTLEPKESWAIGKKGVTCLAYNIADSTLCIFKKKTCQIYKISKNRASLIQRFKLLELPLEILWTDYYMLVMTAGGYYICDAKRGISKLIFACENPLMVRIYSDRILVKRGLKAVILKFSDENRETFVTEEDVFTWALNPIDVLCRFPYLISFYESHIEVRDCSRWNVLQKVHGNREYRPLVKDDLIAFGGNEKDNFFFVYFGLSVSVFVLKNYFSQAMQMIANGFEKEAIHFYSWIGRQDDEYDRNLSTLNEKAGWVNYENLNFKVAFEYFDGYCSRRKVLNRTFSQFLLDPEEMTTKLDLLILIRTKYPDAELWSLRPIWFEAISNLEFFLCSTENDADNVLVSKIALVLISCFYHLEKLEDFLKDLWIFCSDVELFNRLKCWLSNNSSIGLIRYHVFRGEKEIALEVLASILESERICISSSEKSLPWAMDQNSFDYLGETVNILKTCDDWPLIKKFLPLVNQKDSSQSLSIVKSAIDRGLIDAGVDAVISILENADESLIIPYLEWRVFERETGDDICECQIQLALNYIEQFAKYQKRSELFVRLLREKHEYDALLLFNSIGDLPLYHEKVILLEKLEMHSVSLQIIVDCIKDKQMAEQYCLTHEREPEIFEILLKKLLDNQNIDDSIELLNKYPTKIDTVIALRLLPHDIAFSRIYPYLCESFKHVLHTSRQLEIVAKLEKIRNLSDRIENFSLRNKHVLVDERSLCHICKSSIFDMPFVISYDEFFVHCNCIETTKTPIK